MSLILINPRISEDNFTYTLPFTYLFFNKKLCFSAQLVASGVKGLNTQSMRSVPAGIVSFSQTSGPPLQLLEALRRPSAPLQSSSVKPQLTRNAAGKLAGHLTGAIFKMTVPNTGKIKSYNCL